MGSAVAIAQPPGVIQMPILTVRARKGEWAVRGKHREGRQLPRSAGRRRTRTGGYLNPYCSETVVYVSVLATLSGTWVLCRMV